LAPLFFFGSSLRPVSSRPDLHSWSREDFRSPSGSNAFTHDPIAKAALVALGEAWPRFLSLEELCSQARAKLGGEAIPSAATRAADKQQAEQALMKLYTIGGDLVSFRLRPLRVTKQPDPKPVARPLARWQAMSSASATNLRHESVNLNDFSRQV